MEYTKQRQWRHKATAASHRSTKSSKTAVPRTMPSARQRPGCTRQSPWVTSPWVTIDNPSSMLEKGAAYQAPFVQSPWVTIDNPSSVLEKGAAYQAPFVFGFGCEDGETAEDSVEHVGSSGLHPPRAEARAQNELKRRRRRRRRRRADGAPHTLLRTCVSAY